MKLAQGHQSKESCKVFNLFRWRECHDVVTTLFADQVAAGADHYELPSADWRDIG